MDKPVVIGRIIGSCQAEIGAAQTTTIGACQDILKNLIRVDGRNVDRDVRDRRLPRAVTVVEPVGHRCRGAVVDLRQQPWWPAM
ncbi:hypothetical protein M2280_001341 [Prescottella agglutinans]|uniref:Uncharacterized protein n=1 Tax=Prescottella agglutinans TaxID=1644129 RepID=A0ABT6M751_9NOCA|nr:hypothetical protein [Prescottella agglutinans]